MIYDVLIIGAGPCGLAVASRLCEPTPSALFTDAEHERYWKKSNFNQHTLEHEARQGHARRVREANRQKEVRTHQEGLSMVVLDATADSWMSLWRSRFQALNISHLRSPLFFHCDPRDRDGLLAYSHVEDRLAEMKEITNVVGKEVSKHQKKKSRKSRGCQCDQATRHLRIDVRDQIDYFTPSSDLFDDYCNNIVKRYDLNNLIQKAEVLDISYGDVGIATEDAKLFTVTTSENQTYLARIVVLATGPGKSPSLPQEFRTLSTSNAGSSIHHVLSRPNNRLPSHIHLKQAPFHPIQVAIVGGGLTSAQVTHLLSQNPNVAKVHLICRSKLKVKHFDVDLNWVSKLRNHAMSAYWSADTDQERFQMLKSAKNGGSIPPAWEKTLRKLVKSERLQIWEETIVDTESSIWDDESKSWDLKLKKSTSSSSSLSSSSSPSTPVLSQISLSISHLLISTTSPPDITSLPYLSTLHSSHPINSINGLPQLSHDLKWDENVPLFVTGAMAGLRLGPGAGNLAGARQGAERVAWGVEALIGKEKTRKGEIKGTEEGREATLEEYTNGFGNRFEVLGGGSE